MIDFNFKSGKGVSTALAPLLVIQMLSQMLSVCQLLLAGIDVLSLSSVDSEGNPILNSEGFPVYPQTFDSEGHPLWPWYRVMGRGPRIDMKHWPKLPSGFHQLQEEPI